MDREVDATYPAIPSNDNYSNDPEIWDLIVVGAGVAGAALTYAQGKVKGYALFKGGKEFQIAYPLEGYPEDVAGRSFHHGRFVQRLRQEAHALPSVTVRQATVRSLIGASGKQWHDGEVVHGVSYKSAADGEVREARAHLTVVCDGMYSALRSKLTEPDIRHPSYFLGIILKNASLPYPNHGHVVLGNPSPILLYPIGTSEVRVLVDVPGDKLPSSSNGDLTHYLKTVVAPQIPAKLQPAFLDALAAAPPRTMRNKQMAAKAIHRPGALLLGDSFNMRHPLTGGGMTVALGDCNLLHSMLSPLPSLADAHATAASTQRFYVRRKPLSATINTLANALYKVFCASQLDAHEHMRQACFDYLQQGGEQAQGPISLLGGLNPRPAVLVRHFFSVAVFGIAGLPRHSKNPVKLLWMAIMLLYVACSIIVPIILAEGPLAVFAPALSRRPQMRTSPSSLQLSSQGGLMKGIKGD